MIRVCGLLLLATAVHVRAACPTYADIDASSVPRALAQVEPMMVECQNDPIAAGLYGGLLLRSGQIDEAAVWLEKALLLSPDQPGVQADYALALAAQGDRFSSSEIAGELLQMESVPRDLEAILSSLSEVSRWETRFSASAGVGYSSNIDFVPSLNTLDLTFGDDGVASLPLTEPSSPNAAGFFQQSAVLGFRWSGAGYSVLPSLRVIDRSSAGSSSSDYVSSKGSLQIVDPEQQRGMRVGYGLVDYGSNQDRQELRLGYSQTLQQVEMSSCRLGVSADWWSQSYGGSSLNDTRIYQAGVWGDCAEGRFFAADLSLDRPVNDRVGGDRTRWAVVGGQEVPLELGTLTVSVGWARESDSETYSEFLARGASRSITTFDLGATWKVPLSSNLTASAEAGLVRQTSNVALFDATASEFSLNLIYTP